MIPTKFGDVFALVQLQRTLAQYGTANIALTILVAALVVLLIDYAYMAYLHFKMVSFQMLLSTYKRITTPAWNLNAG